MGSCFFKKGRQVHYLFSSSEAFMQEVTLQRVSKENAIKGPREAPPPPPPHAIFKGSAIFFRGSEEGTE